MADLSTNYAGLELRNPIIVGSSGLTNSINKIKEAEEKGAGAVVLKSLFEEQILYNIHQAKQESIPSNYPEAADYIANYTQSQQVDKYLQLIKGAKEQTDIPVIASINCVSDTEWTSFASKIEDAGADALELNIFVLPSDKKKDGTQNEKLYFNIIDKVLKQVNIPVVAKISYYFSGLANFTQKLSWTGIKGLVLFNRFYSPDIDIDKFSLKASNVFSSPDELPVSLRWVAMLSDVVHCDISASTGVHSGDAVVKQLLAGAASVQMSSLLYKEGFGKITEVRDFLSQWMDKHGFESIDEFKGRMSFKKAENPAAYERVQFMKHFSGIE
ncbi:MAG: dihydroorotate dehydrogenase-like protein [Bacteroidales bacterium]|nr:dihydroorotate dehydrogenase-like protein [Bacteroidales bacterium]